MRAMRVVVIALGAACALLSASPAFAAKPRVQPLVASFANVSYAPGERAQLIVRTRLAHVELQVLRAGAERAWDAVGKPWGPPRKLSFSRKRLVHRVTVRPGAWDSGLYLVRLTSRGGRSVEYAPFVLRPSVYGRNRFAIV